MSGEEEFGDVLLFGEVLELPEVLLFGEELEVPDVLLSGEVEELPLVPVVLDCDPLLPTEPVDPEDVELFTSAEFDWLMSVEEEAFGLVEGFELPLFGEVLELPDMLLSGDVEGLLLVPVVLDCDPLLPTEPADPDDVELFTFALFD